MLVYAGIDEAGYGPLLGPLCLGCAVFAVRDHDPSQGAPDLWAALKRGVCRSPSDRRGRVAVEDSKRLKGPNDAKAHPLRHLERGVLAFMGQCAGAPGARCPCDDDALFEALGVSLPAPTVAPWYQGSSRLPLAHDAAQIELATAIVTQSLAESSITCEGLSCIGVDVREFNQQLARTRNKSAISFEAIAKLLDRLWRRWPQAHPRAVVDRQGGRLMYREPLAQCFPESSITILGETERISRYRLEREGSLLTVSFEAESEGAHLPTALASMAAKLCRELLMARLNAWFARHHPAVRSTAGYVADGRRWLSEMSAVLDGLGIDREGLVRRG
jgi:ribonuclease HII